MSLTTASDKPIKPELQLLLHGVVGFVSDALQKVKLNVIARAAHRIDVFPGDHGIYGLVLGSVPDLDGAGRDHHTLALSGEEGAVFVRIEADGIFLFFENLFTKFDFCGILIRLHKLNNANCGIFFSRDNNTLFLLCYF